MQKFMTITFSWMVIAFLITTYDHFLLQSDFVGQKTDVYTFGSHLLINIGAALIGSFFGGIFLVYFVNEKLRDQRYGTNILAVVVSFVVLTSFITVMLGITYVPYVASVKLFSAEWEIEFLNFLRNSLHLKNVIVWSIVVAFTQLFLHINDKFGHGILWQFIRGKYHSPIEENRVFMFLDIRSSTSIAESLGNEDYYNLLRDFYSDITNSIIVNKGSIYQYVGDEVVISWKFEDGIEDNHCINCFVGIKKAIDMKRDRYMLKYGLVPNFKAGIHYGKVTAGEIGVLKRDITFSGDVLNTASRIQEQCNEYGVNILVAKELVDKLPASKIHSYQAIGEIQLRGKQKALELCTLEQHTAA